MSFYRKIKYFLVHTLKYSNKESQKLIDSGQVEINNLVTFENCFLSDTSQIKVNGIIVRQKKDYVYLKFYKPVGYESSLNDSVNDNLSLFFKDFEGLSIAGRLDKQSEGLLLLSNDGKWVEKICHPDFEKEKEYEVTLDKVVKSDLCEVFEKGMMIGDHQTKPALCEIIAPNKIKVFLKEGKNRQIRRMCRKTGYEVENLKRLRVDAILLEDLKPGEHIEISKSHLRLE